MIFICYDFTFLFVIRFMILFIKCYNFLSLSEGACSYVSYDFICLTIKCSHFFPHHQRVPVVMLAGEANSPSHFSTVHGAMESGHQQAERYMRCNGYVASLISTFLANITR